MPVIFIYLFCEETLTECLLLYNKLLVDSWFSKLNSYLQKMTLVSERERKRLLLYESDMILYLEIQENQLKIVKLASQN